MPDQLDSFEAQECHYSSFIKSHPGWVFSGIYSDEGISSTKTKHRQGLQEMMADARSHKFDLILTKSLSRFARNTVVALSLVRELTALGITIDFEKESINTLDYKGEVLLTIMASLAQQERPNGMTRPSGKSFKTRSTWAMPFCRKPTPSTF